MKKIIGIALLILFFGGFAVGFSTLLHWSGLSWIISILIALGTYVAAALIIAFVHLVAWLLT